MPNHAACTYVVSSLNFFLCSGFSSFRVCCGSGDCCSHGAVRVCPVVCNHPLVARSAPPTRHILRFNYGAAV